jgi:chromosome segregation ATPase
MSSAMLAFDTHKYVKTLTAAGYTEAQAEAQSSALTEALDSHIERLATKEDVRQLGTELRGEISELRGEIGQVRSDVTHLRHELRWLVGPSLAGIFIGVMAILFKNAA